MAGKQGERPLPRPQPSACHPVSQQRTDRLPAAPASSLPACRGARSPAARRPGQLEVTSSLSQFSGPEPYPWVFPKLPDLLIRWLIMVCSFLSGGTAHPCQRAPPPPLSPFWPRAVCTLLAGACLLLSGAVADVLGAWRLWGPGRLLKPASLLRAGEIAPGGRPSWWWDPPAPCGMAQECWWGPPWGTGHLADQGSAGSAQPHPWWGNRILLWHQQVGSESAVLSHVPGPGRYWL